MRIRFVVFWLFYLRFLTDDSNLILCSEWYSYHFPELVKIVNDNLLFAKLVHLIQRRTNINEELFEYLSDVSLCLRSDSMPQIEEIVMDSTKTQQIHDAAKISMGVSNASSYSVP